MKIIKLSSSFAAAWDEVVHASDDAWIFHFYDWQIFNAKVWNLVSQDFLVEHQGKVIGIFPLQMNPKNKSLRSTVMGFGGAAVRNDVPHGIRKKALQIMYDYAKFIGHQNGLFYIDVLLPPLAPITLNDQWHVNPLVNYGYEDSSTHTWMVDLTQTKDELLKNLSYDARRSIKKSEECGYILKPLESIVEMEEYYAVHCETYKRTGVQPHPKEYFLGIYNSMCQKGHATIWKAVTPKGKIVGFNMTAMFKKTAYYWSGCCKNDYMDSGVNYLLQYHAMMWAKEQGVQWFDNGEAFPNTQDAKLKGLTTFKGKFGGELHRAYKGKLVLKKEVGDRGALRDWLRSTARLIEPIIGRRIVLGIVTFARKILQWIRSYRKVAFIKPYWGLSEIVGAFLGRGQSNKKLEEKIRQKLNIKGVIVLTSSGRTALELALRVLKKEHPEKQKVIISTYGCRGIFDPVIRAGLIPILVDIDKNLNLSAVAVNKVLVKQDDVLAILFPHIGGCLADIDEIVDLAKEKGVVIIEDVCQALGIQKDGEYVGTQSDMAIFSFGMGKNLMASAGGMLISNIFQEEIEQELLCLGNEDKSIVRQRFQKLFFKYFIGWPFEQNHLLTNAYQYYRLSALDAFLLDKQLDQLERIIKKRQDHAQEIKAALKTANINCFLPEEPLHIYTKFSVIFEEANLRDKLYDSLHRAGVEIEEMYIPLHLRDVAAEFAEEHTCSYAERIYKNVWNIPVRPNLAKREMNRILKGIKNANTRRN